MEGGFNGSMNEPPLGIVILLLVSIGETLLLAPISIEFKLNSEVVGGFPNLYWLLA